ncbi:MAG TPA: hypothetical protein VGN06_05470 [Gaiellaceae bacterium]|jgi:Rieske Fe-S protein
MGAERYTRSRLLERATLAVGGLVGLDIALPAAGLAFLPSFLGQHPRPVDLGPVDAFPEGQYVLATYLADPRVGEASRRTAYVRNNGLLGDLPSFTIMSSRCTHVGCPTQPNGPLFAAQRTVEATSGGPVALTPAQPSGFGCPCNGSQFDNEGKPHRRSRAARARPVSVLDPERPAVARRAVQRESRRRHGCGCADP